MSHSNMKKLALSTLIAATLSSSAYAVEAPATETLNNRMYGGIHALYINPDNDRLIMKEGSGSIAPQYSSLDNNGGFGAELGYRFKQKFEARFSFSFLELEAKKNGFDAPNGSLTALDLLYFPTGKNFYALAGLDNMDIIDSELSLDMGAGYRHYITENAALYFEGKGHYQFDENHKDFSARLGFIFFFGDSGSGAKAASAPAPAPAPAKVAPVAAAPVDSDNDGVIDANDNCPNTPAAHKVDANGCTVFLEDEVSIELVVPFANNSSEVAASEFAEIEQVAQFLKSYPETSITIEGHTSAQGNAAYNKKLSQKRADAVVEVLVKEFDIAASRLAAKGLGEEQLLDTANTKAAHAKNRRIEARATVAKKTPQLK